MPEDFQLPYDIDNAATTLGTYLMKEGVFEGLRRLQAELDEVISRMEVGSRLTVTLDKNQKHYRATIHYEYPNKEYPSLDKVMILGGMRYEEGGFVFDNGVDALALIADTVGSEIQNDILQHDFSAR